MPLSKKVLEDSVRLARIRTIKRNMYILQVALLVALAFVIVFVIGDAAFKPSLYLPIDQFVAVLVLVMLVICVESFFFRILEIRFARSSSARHLMAKNSISRSVLFAIVSAIVTIVLMVPQVLAVTEDATQQTERITGGEDLSFWSVDPLALQRVSELRLSCSSTVNVYLVSDTIYQEYEDSVGDMYFMRINRDDYELVDTLTIPVPDMGHSLLHLVVHDTTSSGAYVTVDIVKDTSSTITGIVSLLSLAFLVTNIAWIAYLIPIERKYSQGSIYK
jgi:hypothetical protein